MKIAVIGAGASGYFAAISAAHHHPDARIVLFEKSGKSLAKVKVSGGGRCNVTNATFSPAALSKNYPRGGKQLKKTFSQFQATDTIEWFSERGVELHTEADNRMFPTTDDSQTIIDCLVLAAQEAGVQLRMQTPVRAILQDKDQFRLNDVSFDAIIVATGGSPKVTGFDWLVDLGHTIASPVPSLFTFNMPGNRVVDLMGVVIPNAIVRIQGTKLAEQGPVLITHWGMSGPAVLKLSAWGARELAQCEYRFTAQINWIGETNEAEASAALDNTMATFRKKKLANACPFELPRKFWEYILEKAGCNPDSPWMDTSKKERNRLLNMLLNDCYEVNGKTTFKEEFVTCGGVERSEVDFTTMQSRVAPGMYFAGEVLDVDGVTGGFNFQAAWTTGYVAGKLSGRAEDKDLD